MKKLLLSISVLLSVHAFACHGLALVGLNVTTNATNIVINASSDAASCGCGPYWMEVEVSNTTSFTGASPAPSSSAWGSLPWFHSLLNVPNYNAASGWPDNCVIEPYTTINIPFSSFCPGSTIYLRVREYVEGSSSAGPWSIAASVLIPGSTPVLAGSASTSDSILCPGDSTQLTVSHNGCSGNYSISWSPSGSLSSPTSITTDAFPSATTTYTVSFTDNVLVQTFTTTITIGVTTAPAASATSTIASCNDSDAVITTSVTGGTAPYSYYWNNGDTGAVLNGLISGTYQLAVYDVFNCIDTLTVVVGDSCDFVWPGDANDDAVADMNDILAIGLASATTGPTRAAASVTWIGQYCPPWGIFAPLGTDGNFIDCNGDGTVDANDTTAVILNYGLVHNNRVGNQQPAGSAPPLQVMFAQDTMAPSSPGSFTIALGDNTTSANNVYGLSFTLNYDETYIDPQSLSVSASGSWLGTIGTDMIVVKKIHAGMGMMDVAITRMDQQAMNGMGTILTFSFMSTSTLTGTGQSATALMSISNVNCISNNGSSIPVSIVDDAVVIQDDFMMGINSMNSTATSVSPNPASTQFIVHSREVSGAETFVLYNSLGQEVKRTELTKQDQEISCEELAPGIYFYSILSEGDVTGNGRLVKE